MTDEITLDEVLRRGREFGGVLRDQWRTVAVCMALSAALGSLVAFGSAVEYTAQTRLVPFRKAPSAAVSGVPGLAGLRLPGGAGTDVTISSDLYPEVVNTLDFRVSVAETPIAFSGQDSLRTAAWYFRHRYRPPAIDVVRSYTLGLHWRLIGAMRALIPSRAASAPPVTNPSVVRDSGGRRPPRYVDPGYRGLVNTVGGRLTISFGAQGGIIEISARMPDAVAAADLVRVAALQLQQTVIAYEAQKADQQVRFVAEQQARAQERYDAAESALAGFVARNRTLGPVAEIERSRLEREASLAFELLQQASRDLDQARIARNQDAPVFMTLEEATVPTSPSTPGPARALFVSLVVGAAFGCAIVAVRAFVRRTVV